MLILLADKGQFPIGWLNAVADWNILEKLLHEIGLQLFMFDDPELLNDVADANILVILVTLETSQDPIFWLKEGVDENILAILILLADIGQFPIGWLNPDDWNMPEKLLQEIGLQLFIVFDPELLNEVALANMFDILVTAFTFQLPIF